jgi:hypothetical protein
MFDIRWDHGAKQDMKRMKKSNVSSIENPEFQHAKLPNWIQVFERQLLARANDFFVVALTLRLVGQLLLHGVDDLPDTLAWAIEKKLLLPLPLYSGGEGLG